MRTMMNATMILVALTLALDAPTHADEPPPCVEGEPRVFDDVPASHPLCGWIEELWHRGATAGCGDGNYCPNDALTRGQAASVVLRAERPQDPWVRVGFDGEMTAGEGVLQVFHPDPGSGVYGILFDRDIDDCAAVAMARDSLLFAHVAIERIQRAPVLSVKTGSVGGVLADRPFDLIMRCPRQVGPPTPSDESNGE